MFPSGIVGANIVCAAMSSKECKKIAMLPQFAKRARNELEEVGGGG